MNRHFDRFSRPLCGLLAFAFTMFGATLFAEEESPWFRGARSVHAWHNAPDAEWMYGEIKVEESVPGSYFSVIGFKCGYFGIQELLDGSKVAIFSIWDPGDPFDFGARPDRKSTRLNSSHYQPSRMPSSA